MAEKWTTEQAGGVFRNVADTWPKHEMTLTAKRDWARELKAFTYEVVNKAIGRYRRAQLDQADRDRRRDTTWDVPILRDLIGQCQMIVGASTSEAISQAQWAERYYGMSRGNQARSWVASLERDLLVDHFEADHERSKCRELLSRWKARLDAEAKCEEREAVILADLKERGCDACAVRILLPGVKRICRGCQYKGTKREP